jgi:two-component system sensor kinase FixL
MPILLAMSYELSCDLVHSAQLSNQLQESEAELQISKQRMRVAARSGKLRMWEWDIERDEIWSTDDSPGLYGISEPQKISFERFLNTLYEEDREQVRLAMEKSLIRGNDHYESEFRIRLPDGQMHWFNSRGRIEFSDSAQPLRMLGVTIDITRRKQAELAVQQQRNELTHLSRVATLGELSGSLAHELNQPLAAILSNAQAAQRFLALGNADLAEIQDILEDIVNEDKRAVEVIQRLRLLLKKGEVQHLPVNLNNVVEEVLKIINSDLVNHNINVDIDLAEQLPAVIGDRVQLQQVLLNLIINGCEAMALTHAGNRRLFVRTERNGIDRVQVSVGDQGPGIPAERLGSIFEPFFTTKLQGMGLGLAICRTIITAHGGRLWAINNTPTGAIFHFKLPASPGESA